MRILKFLGLAILFAGCAHQSTATRVRSPAQEVNVESTISFVESESPASLKRPIVCFIPGGPGLSSETLRSMENLKSSFDLAFIDPPGTGKSPEAEDPQFKKIVQSLIESVLTLKRPVVLVGHSEKFHFQLKVGERAG